MYHSYHQYTENDVDGWYSGDRNLRSNYNSTKLDVINYTITTSVSIRVTPLYNHFFSWGILWAGFVLASGFAGWQVFQEYRTLKVRQALNDEGEPGSGVEGEGYSTADETRSIVSQFFKSLNLKKD